MARLNLSPPWIIYFKQVEAFFKYDPTVRVLYDDEKYEVKIYVEDEIKADFLTQYLRPEVDFGNIKVKVIVVPANKLNDNFKSGSLTHYEIIFFHNTAVSYIHKVDNIFVKDITYIVFKNEIVQFFTDDISDINGFTSTLYEDIAREIFINMDNVFFCTDVPAEKAIFRTKNTSLGSPLGEWP